MEINTTPTLLLTTLGILASVVTASLSYYFTKVQQIGSEDRKLKEEFYRAFIKAISDTAIDNENEVAWQKLSEGFNTLTLVSSREVVKELMEYHKVIKPVFRINMSDQEYGQEHDSKLRDLIIEMRRDLFGKKRAEEDFPEIHLVGMGKKHKQEGI